MRWRKVGHVCLMSSGSQLGSQAMRASRASTIVVIVYVLSLFIGVASELSHARPVIGSMADITDIHIKIRGFRVQ
eukprot:961996-Pelagomonas_calceolata.AAC.1